MTPEGKSKTLTSMFNYDTHPTDEALERLLNRYERTGRAVPVDFRSLVTCLPNAERATHLLHPYPAKLLMHIPFFFLANSILSREGDVVADPFCGSGTVLLESQLAGRRAVGADSNPLARLLTAVKTSPIPLAAVDRGIDRLLSRISRALPKWHARCGQCRTLVLSPRDPSASVFARCDQEDSSEGRA